MPLTSEEWAGTLYRALDELVDEAFVEALDDGERPVVEIRRKRYWRSWIWLRAALDLVAVSLSGRVGSMESVGRDVRTGIRSLSRDPGFALFAVVSAGEMRDQTPWVSAPQISLCSCIWRRTGRRD